MPRGKMAIGMSIRGLGYHPAAWRHPDVPTDGTLRFDHYARSAMAAERGKCDLLFFADGIGVRERDVPAGSLNRMGYEIFELEPMTLLPALAVVTKNIGLVTTASTTYNEPYNLARKFVSWYVGQNNVRVITHPAVPVAPADAACFELEHDTGHRRQRVGDPLNRRRPLKFIVNSSFHDLVLCNCFLPSPSRRSRLDVNLLDMSPD